MEPSIVTRSLIEPIHRTTTRRLRLLMVTKSVPNLSAARPSIVSVHPEIASTDHAEPATANTAAKQSATVPSVLRQGRYKSTRLERELHRLAAAGQTTRAPGAASANQHQIAQAAGDNRTLASAAEASSARRRKSVNFNTHENSTHHIPTQRNEVAHDSSPEAVPHPDTELQKAHAIVGQIIGTVDEDRALVLDVLSQNRDLTAEQQAACYHGMTAFRHVGATYAVAKSALDAASSIVTTHPQLVAEIARLCVSVARVGEDTAQTAITVLETSRNQPPQITSIKIREARAAHKTNEASLKAAQQSLLKIDSLIGNLSEAAKLEAVQAAKWSVKAYRQASNACQSGGLAYRAALMVARPVELSRSLQKKQQLLSLKLPTVMRNMELHQRKQEVLQHIPQSAVRMSEMQQVSRLLDDSES